MQEANRPFKIWTIDGGFLASLFDSPMKQEIKEFMKSEYDMTTDKPATDFFGMHLVKNRSTLTIDITQPTP